MVSKELLQETMSCLTVDEIISTDNNKIDNNIYYKVKEIDILQSINVYELMHRCKEWAYAHGYDLVSTNVTSDNAETNKRKPLYYCYVMDKKWCFGVDDFDKSKKEVCGFTEFEAVVKACDYIMELKNGRIS